MGTTRGAHLNAVAAALRMCHTNMAICTAPCVMQPCSSATCANKPPCTRTCLRTLTFSGLTCLPVQQVCMHCGSTLAAHPLFRTRSLSATATQRPHPVLPHRTHCAITAVLSQSVSPRAAAEAGAGAVRAGDRCRRGCAPPGVQPRD